MMIKKALWPFRGLWHIVKYLPRWNREVCYLHSAFGQFGEDVILSSLLDKDRTDGFYVDVGAFHPIQYSNTYRFYTKGWRGINIEPNPRSFGAIQKARTRDINLNIAISEAPAQVLFQCADACSGIVDENYNGEKSSACNTVNVSAMPLRLVLEEHVDAGQEIDFLSVDCEGHDEVVVRSNDWNSFRPKVILVEQHSRSKETTLFSYLVSQGYCFYCSVGLTMFFLREDLAEGVLPASYFRAAKAAMTNITA